MVVVIAESGRATDRADDEDADADQHQRQPAEASQKKRELAIGLRLLRDPLAALGIDLGQFLKIFVEGHADVAIGLVIAPFAAGLVADLDRAPNQFFSEFDELIDALFEDSKLLGVIRLDNGFPLLDDVNELITELMQSVAVFLHDRWFSRHVNATGFHHYGIDQRIHALDIERRLTCGFDGLGEFGAATGVVVGQCGNGRGQKRKQGEDRIKLKGKRKA